MSRFVEFTLVKGRVKFPLNVERVTHSLPDPVGGTLIYLESGLELNINQDPAEVKAKLRCEPLSGVLDNVAAHGERQTDELGRCTANKHCQLCYPPAPPTESEAVQLLERWVDWYGGSQQEPSSLLLCSTTKALLAKLKGGK